jgi:hypothetical protein
VITNTAVLICSWPGSQFTYPNFTVHTFIRSTYIQATCPELPLLREDHFVLFLRWIFELHENIVCKHVRCALVTRMPPTHYSLCTYQCKRLVKPRRLILINLNVESRIRSRHYQNGILSTISAFVEKTRYHSVGSSLPTRTYTSSSVERYVSFTYLFRVPVDTEKYFEALK